MKSLTLECIINGYFNTFHEFDSSFGVSFNTFLLLLVKGKEVLSYFIKLFNSSSFSSVFIT